MSKWVFECSCIVRRQKVPVGGLETVVSAFDLICTVRRVDEVLCKRDQKIK